MKTRTDEAISLLLEKGKQKTTDAKESEYYFKAPFHKKMNTLTKAIARAVMRYPNSEIRNHLNNFHTRMKEHFLNMSDEALDWLLGGCSETARGGFDNAEKLRAFLKKDPRTLSSSRLIMGIETITAAMGYRAIDATWAKKPIVPKKCEEEKMHKKIQILVKENIVPSVHTVYSSHEDRVTKNYRPDDIVLDPGYVSDASDVDEEEQRPTTLMEQSRWRKTHGLSKNDYTWIGASIENGVPIRAHVSGTVALASAALEGLSASLFESTHTKKIIYSAIFLPAYMRGDFHSFAETYAGIEYYFSERAKKYNFSSKKTEPIQPHDALQHALKALICAADSDKHGDKMSLQEAMRETIPEITKLIRKPVLNVTFKKPYSDIKEAKSPSKYKNDLDRMSLSFYEKKGIFSKSYEKKKRPLKTDPAWSDRFFKKDTSKKTYEKHPEIIEKNFLARFKQ